MNRDGQPVLSVEVIVSQRRSWVDLSSTPELLFVFWGGGFVQRGSPFLEFTENAP